MNAVRQIAIAEALNACANGFDESAEKFEEGPVTFDEAKYFRHAELEDNAGSLIIAAWSHDLLPAIEGLGSAIEFHTATSDPLGPGSESRYARCPANLFLEVTRTILPASLADLFQPPPYCLSDLARAHATPEKLSRLQRRAAASGDRHRARCCRALATLVKNATEKRTPQDWAYELQPKPRWDESDRQLRYRGRIVAAYRRQAENQCLILKAFEESGWPRRIFDPLPRNRSNTQTAQARLRTTVFRLNEKLEGSGLRFVSGETSDGTEVHWGYTCEADRNST